MGGVEGEEVDAVDDEELELELEGADDVEEGDVEDEDPPEHALTILTLSIREWVDK